MHCVWEQVAIVSTLVIADEIIRPRGNTIEVVDEKIGFSVITGWFWMLSDLMSVPYQQLYREQEACYPTRILVILLCTIMLSEDSLCNSNIDLESLACPILRTPCSAISWMDEKPGMQTRTLSRIENWSHTGYPACHSIWTTDFGGRVLYAAELEGRFW